MRTLFLLLLLSQNGPNMAGPSTAIVGDKLVDGRACLLGAQCKSGFCTDSVCCNTACSGDCAACSVAAGGSTDGVCANYASGSTGSPSCSPYECSGGANCSTTCAADSDCVSGYYCNATVCTIQVAQGGACSVANACTSGFCADSKCCNTACVGGCAGCSVAAGADSDGTCKTYADANVGSPSCTPYLCDGSALTCPTTCAADVDCSAGYLCVANACVVDYVWRLLWTPISAGNECDGTWPAGVVAPATTFTVTRAHTGGDTATCEKADGTIVTMAGNTPRIGGWGIWAEGFSANGIGSSASLVGWTTCVNATITSNTTVSPDGTTTADEMTSTSAGGYCEINGGTSTGNTVYSLFVKTASGTQAYDMSVWDVVAATEKFTAAYTATTSWPHMHARPFLRGSGSGANAKWWRIYPGGKSGTGTLIIWGTQKETGSARIGPTSYIPTTGSGVNRNADIIAFPNPLTFPTTAGRVTYDYVTTGQYTTANLTVFNAMVATNGIQLLAEPGNKRLRFYYAGANNRNHDFAAAWTNGSTVRVVQSWTCTSPDTCLVSTVDGIAPTGNGNSFDSPAAAGAGTFHVGSDGTNTTCAILNRICFSASATGCQ